MRLENINRLDKLLSSLRGNRGAEAAAAGRDEINQRGIGGK